MGQFIQFGQSASSVSISRVDIAVGYTGYCIPLDNNTLAKNIVYVRGFGNLELDSQSMVEFRLEPQLYYFFWLLVSTVISMVRLRVTTLRLSISA